MTKRRLVPAAACAVAALVMAALLALDATPRFMLGDSMSYLMTGRNGVDSYPPDRSWIYGLAARGLVVATHGFRAQMLLDAAGLAAFVFAAVSLLPARRGATLVAIAFAVAIACDPLTQTYVRFTMSDLPAALLFAGFVCGLAGRFAPAPRRHAAAAWLGIVACGAGAVAFRVAYVPIELGTAVLAALPSLARRGTVRPLLLAGLVPLASVVALGQLNGAVFAHRFGDGPFVNRLSGVFLMGVFSPALTARDIRAAGVPVSDAEVAAMRLGGDDNRIAQVWGSQSFWLRNVVAAKLHASGEYDRREDAAAHRMVVVGLEHHPLAFAGVYLRSLEAQFAPAEWRRHLVGELGLTRTLDGWFVDDMNRHLRHPIAADVTHRSSLLPRALQWSVGAYPVLLGWGLIAAVVTLVRSRSTAAHLVAAAVIVTFGATPLYSNYVIPRYLLPAVMFAWLLIPMALLDVDTNPALGEMTARATRAVPGTSRRGEPHGA